MSQLIIGNGIRGDVPVGGGAVFASDNFTDTAGTLLSAHTPSGGGTWTKHTLYSETLVITDANRVRKDASANGTVYHHSGTSATADYDVEGVLFVASNIGVFPGIAGRIDTAADTYYFMRYNGTTQVWDLMKAVAGSFTALGSQGQVLTVGNSYLMKLQMRGNQIRAYVDGSPLFTAVTDNSIVAAGKAGFRFFGANSNTTGYHFDSFTATDA